MSGPASSPEVTTRIFLYAHPRTRSNLFMKLLETHPQVTGKQYPFMTAFQNGPEAQLSEESLGGRFRATGLSKEEYDRIYHNATYQSGLDGMEEVIAKASAEGKICVIKEHTVHIVESKLLNANITCPRHESPRPTIIDKKLNLDGSSSEEMGFPVPNPTLLPDRIVASVFPVIIIRHPMFTYPSCVRAWSVFDTSVFDPDFIIFTTHRWQRLMYDFYRAYYDKIDPEGKKEWPVVIDGDKLVADTKGQMRKFCALAGIDESLVRYSWNASDINLDAEADKTVKAFIGTIAQSTGVIQGPIDKNASGTTLEEEVKKWTEEWDEKVAQKLKEQVESSMEDYEYLLKFSI